MDNYGAGFEILGRCRAGFEYVSDFHLDPCPVCQARPVRGGRLDWACSTYARASAVRLDSVPQHRARFRIGAYVACLRLWSCNRSTPVMPWRTRLPPAASQTEFANSVSCLVCQTIHVPCH